MILSKCTKIGLIILGILIILNILLTKRLIGNGRSNGDSITIEDSYSETNVRNDIARRVDTIFVTLDNNTDNEERLQEIINDSDSVAIVKQFIELCSKPVK